MVKLLQGTWRAEGTEETRCLALSFSPQNLAEQQKTGEAERAMLCMQETDKQIPVITARAFLKIGLSWEFFSQVGATWKKHFALKTEKSLVEGDQPPDWHQMLSEQNAWLKALEIKVLPYQQRMWHKLKPLWGRQEMEHFRTAQSNASQSCIVRSALTVGAHRSHLRNFPIGWWEW